MRGNGDQLQPAMFSYVSLEQRIPKDHPLRGVRKLVDAVLAGMSKEFDKLYAAVGPALDSTRAIVAGIVAAGFLFGSCSVARHSTSTGPQN